MASGAGEARLVEILPEGPAIVHLWATWCEPCRDELKALDRFRSVLDASGLADRLVFISVDRLPYDRVLDFLRDELDVDLASWQDADGTAGTQFRVHRFPSTVLLNADRAIIWRHTGPANWDDPELRQDLLKLIVDRQSRSD